MAVCGQQTRLIAMACSLLLFFGVGAVLREARADIETATVNGVRVRAPLEAAPKARKLAEDEEGKPATERRDSDFPVFSPTTNSPWGGWGNGAGNSPTQAPAYDPNSIFDQSTTGKPFQKLAGPIIGGVVGAGAVAGVIAISVIQAQKKGTLGGQEAAASAAPGVAAASAPAPTNKVAGAMNLQVPNGGSFMGDTEAQNAVAQGIADAAGVDPKYVHVTNLQSTPPSGARLLEEGVQVSYTIETPPGASATAIQSAMKAVPTASLAAKVQNRVNSVKGPGFTVGVTQQSVQPVAASASALPAISSAAAGSSATQAPTTFLATSAPTTAGPSTAAPAITTVPTVSSGSTESQVIALACGLVLCGCLAMCLAGLASCFLVGRKKRGTSKRVVEEEIYDEQPLMDQQLPGTIVQNAEMAAPDMYSQPATNFNLPATNFNGGLMPGSVPTLQDMMVPMQTMPPGVGFAQPATALGGYDAMGAYAGASPLAQTVPASGLLGQTLPPTGLNLPPTIYG